MPAWFCMVGLADWSTSCYTSQLLCWWGQIDNPQGNILVQVSLPMQGHEDRSVNSSPQRFSFYWDIEYFIESIYSEKLYWIFYSIYFFWKMILNVLLNRLFLKKLCWIVIESIFFEKMILNQFFNQFFSNKWYWILFWIGVTGNIESKDQGLITDMFFCDLFCGI